MNEDELKRLWQKQPVPAEAAAPKMETIKLMKTKMQKLDRTLFWRDARELIACAVIILWFGADFCSGLLGHSQHPGQHLRHAHSALRLSGDVVLVLSAVWIGVKLLAARRTNRAFLHPSSVRDFLGGELDKVNRQIRLLRTVLWWYLLPLFCGVTLVIIGTNPDLEEDALVIGLMAATFGVIYWANLYAVKKTLLPVKAELEQALADAGE